jgi:antitoxin HigA-1
MKMNRVTTHPGEILREEFLRPLGLSVHALATALRVPPNRIGFIVKGERAVTADTALRLGRYFGTSAVFWLNLQTLYDFSKANKKLGRTIAREANGSERTAGGVRGGGGVNAAARAHFALSN